MASQVPRCTDGCTTGRPLDGASARQRGFKVFTPGDLNAPLTPEPVDNRKLGIGAANILPPASQRPFGGGRVGGQIRPECFQVALDALGENALCVVPPGQRREERAEPRTGAGRQQPQAMVGAKV